MDCMVGTAPPWGVRGRAADARWLILWRPSEDDTDVIELGARRGALALASGNADVAVFPGELAFLLGQVRFPDGNHEAPVLADRAALHPGHH